MTGDSMREHLKKRMRDAGMPATGFGFHSFRSGFLACCLLASQQLFGNIDGVLEKTAIHTGWKPLDKVQFSYVKNTTKA